MKRISDIKKWERCEKLLWMSRQNTRSFMPFIYYHEDFYELIKQRLRIENWLCGKCGDSNDAFFLHENEYSWFCKIRFTYEDLRVQVPLMKKTKNGYDVYFAYATCFPKESEAQMMADVLWVLNGLGIVVHHVYVLYLNAQYVRGKILDVDELIIIDDVLFNDKNHKGESIAVLLKQKKRDVLPILKGIDETLMKSNIDKQRSSICTKRMKCLYFDECFPEAGKDTSLWNLVSCSTKFKLMEQGYEDMCDIDIEQIEGTRHQVSQLIAARTKELFFDTYAVKHFFSNVRYPISYLDFEWETYAFPPYEGMRPYDVLTFQYSLHVENEKHELTHYEYLGKHDCRIAFIESLLENLPKEGTIMCFNVEGAEKLRLKQLAKQFPEYEERLRNIWERMIDLSIPFSSGLIYDTRMAGMYSLKKLVSIFTDYDYADMDISHGLEAVRSYRQLEENDVNEEQILKELLAYCAMDTYAEVLIYHWILKQIEMRTN